MTRGCRTGRRRRTSSHAARAWARAASRSSAARPPAPPPPPAATRRRPSTSWTARRSRGSRPRCGATSRARRSCGTRHAWSDHAPAAGGRPRPSSCSPLCPEGQEWLRPAKASCAGHAREAWSGVQGGRAGASRRADLLRDDFRAPLDVTDMPPRSADRQRGVLDRSSASLRAGGCAPCELPRSLWLSVSGRVCTAGELSSRAVSWTRRRLAGLRSAIASLRRISPRTSLVRNRN